MITSPLPLPSEKAVPHFFVNESLLRFNDQDGCKIAKFTTELNYYFKHLVQCAGPENIYVDISDAVSSAEGVLLSNLKVSDHTEA